MNAKEARIKKCDLNECVFNGGQLNVHTRNGNECGKYDGLRKEFVLVYECPSELFQ